MTMWHQEMPGLLRAVLYTKREAARRITRGIIVTAVTFWGLWGVAAWADETPALDAIRILALGDSLTAGLGLDSEQAFPSQLERELTKQGLSVQVFNGGVSGDTSSGARARLDWLLQQEYDYAVVELGANDGLRGVDPALTYDNLDNILDTLTARGIKVLLTGMEAPPNYGKEYGEAFRNVFPRLADKYDGVSLYPFFLDGVAADPKLNQDDGLHPTAEGVAVIVENIMPHMKMMFGDIF